MSERKKIREWFDLFPDPYRDKAFRANKKTDIPEVLEEMCEVDRSVDRAISWGKTDEGIEYWKRICHGLKYFGIDFFELPDIDDELEALDKSRKPTQTPEPILVPLNGTLPDAITKGELEKCHHTNCSDVRHIKATDAGHLYWMSVRSGRGTPPEGAFVEYQANAADGNYEWRPATKPIGGWGKSTYNLRWLPGSSVSNDCVAPDGKNYPPDTIGWWFNTFPEPYRTEAFADSAYSKSRDTPDSRATCAAEAITRGIRFMVAKRTNWASLWGSLQTDPEYLNRLASLQPVVDTKPKTIRAWYESFPEPYKTQCFMANHESPGETELDGECASASDAVTYGIYWVGTEEGDSYWYEIWRGMNNDPQYLVKRAKAEKDEELEHQRKLDKSPARSVAILHRVTELTTTKGTDNMKNGTYSIAKLIAKTETELIANNVALKKLADAQAANKVYLDGIRSLLRLNADGSDKPELAALRAVTLPKELAALAPTNTSTEAQRTTLTVRFKYPRVANNTQRLNRILTDLNALSGTEITWNDDCDFVLSDFTQANAASEIEDSVGFDIPCPSRY